MIEVVTNRRNMHHAYRHVVSNKGSAGVDGMTVKELYPYLKENRDWIVSGLLNGTYKPQPIKGVEIPKSNGKVRLLGVPTVVDRWLQQAVSQAIGLKFETEFKEHRHRFKILFR